MHLRIENIANKKMIGVRIAMSFSVNKTFDLWHSFMNQRNEIKNSIGCKLYSIQYYKPLFFENFDPTAEFDKWAAIEVSEYNNVPKGMESFILHGGLYAVFIYKGDGTDAEKTFTYILKNWLPASEYELDDRCHFEILGEKYKRNSPDSEEEIWIPIIPKKIVT